MDCLHATGCIALTGGDLDWGDLVDGGEVVVTERDVHRSGVLLQVGYLPGTKKRSRLDENLGAIDVTLSANDLSRLDELAPAGVAAGDRYASMATIDR